MNSNLIIRTLALLLTLAAFHSYAVITRHDVDSARYKIDTPPEYFIDMPFQGAAVLIDKHWLLAPAHVIYTFMYEYQNKPIAIHGVDNVIAEVILHPDYERVGASSDNSLLTQLNNSVDIALIRLEHPVTHVSPIPLYGGNDEKGMKVTGFGRGAIGTGLTGEVEDSQGPGYVTYYWYQITKFFSDWAFTQENYQLQQYNNQITEASQQWLKFSFEKEDNAMPLEGTIGSGDSGGAIVIFRDDKPVLLGMASWREFEGDVKQFSFGHYDEVAVFTRVSYFKDWIMEHVETAEVIFR
tara:strand:- start:229 stop:1116 length:888 start_codon:yes stop_codon:yes gene_type:complete